MGFAVAARDLNQDTTLMSEPEFDSFSDGVAVVLCCSHQVRPTWPAVAPVRVGVTRKREQGASLCGSALRRGQELVSHPKVTRERTGFFLRLILRFGTFHSIPFLHDLGRPRTGPFAVQATNFFRRNSWMAAPRIHSLTLNPSRLARSRIFVNNSGLMRTCNGGRLRSRGVCVVVSVLMICSLPSYLQAIHGKPTEWYVFFLLPFRASAGLACG